MCPGPRPGRHAAPLTREPPQDQPAIEALLDRAFGPGRFAKSSERVREVAEFAPELSFLAWGEDGALLGVVRQWRVRVGEAPLVFLGPLAVDPLRQSAGLGGLLVKHALKAAQAAGEVGVLLVGDVPYFTRFGFQAEPAQGVRMPGPVDQRRVLVRPLATLGARLAGPVQAR